MSRLFVAVDLPKPARRALEPIQEEIRDLDGIRVVPPGQLHLTLAFLGEAEPDAVAAALGRVHERAFDLALTGLGRFRAGRGGLILWAGLEPQPALLALERAVSASLGPLAPRRRPFKPHVTIARAKARAPRHRLQALLEIHRELRSSPMEVDLFHLYASRLRPEGAVHTRRQSFVLETSSRGPTAVGGAEEPG